MASPIVQTLIVNYYCTACLPLVLLLSTLTHPSMHTEKGLSSYFEQDKEVLVTTNH